MMTLRTVVASLTLTVFVGCASPGSPEPISGKVQVPEQAESKGIQVPKVVKRVEPVYPIELRKQRIQGSVVIGGTVPKEGGALRNPRIVSSDHPALNQPAMDAVSRWIWRAGLRDGQPVDVEFTTTIKFSVGQ